MAVLLLTSIGTACNRSGESSKIKADTAAPTLKPITPGGGAPGPAHKAR
ncbi:MAG TPA: hypothetical protein VN688_18280 [Gemmataceae bacterium]|nr:hypothetical protein [Gemmataceae bacterium]